MLCVIFSLLSYGVGARKGRKKEGKKGRWRRAQKVRVQSCRACTGSGGMLLTRASLASANDHSQRARRHQVGEASGDVIVMRVVCGYVLRRVEGELPEACTHITKPGKPAIKQAGKYPITRERERAGARTPAQAWPMQAHQTLLPSTTGRVAKVTKHRQGRGQGRGRGRQSMQTRRSKQSR